VGILNPASFVLPYPVLQRSGALRRRLVSSKLPPSDRPVYNRPDHPENRWPVSVSLSGPVYLLLRDMSVIVQLAARVESVKARRLQQKSPFFGLTSSGSVAHVFTKLRNAALQYLHAPTVSVACEL
jgi:hypothetical protein